MKKILLAILLCVFVHGCAIPLDEQQQAAFSRHPEWSEHHKQLIRMGTFETGMTKEQVELTRGWELGFEWSNSSGYSYYKAGDCGMVDGRFHTFDYMFCFYDGKLQSWNKSKRIHYDY